jgi:hypothetical protein
MGVSLIHARTHLSIYRRSVHFGLVCLSIRQFIWNERERGVCTTVA